MHRSDLPQNRQGRTSQLENTNKLDPSAFGHLIHLYSTEYKLHTVAHSCIEKAYQKTGQEEYVRRAKHRSVRTISFNHIQNRTTFTEYSLEAFTTDRPVQYLRYDFLIEAKIETNDGRGHR